MSILKSYIRLYKGQYLKFVQSISLSLLQSVIIVPVALLVRIIFDRALPDGNFNQLVWLCLGIGILYLLNGGLTLLTRFITLKTTKRVIKVIRNIIVEKVYLLPKRYFTDIDRKKLHTVIVQDSFRLDVMSNGLVAQLLPALFISSGLVFVLIFLDISLFLLVVIIAPVLFVSGKVLGRALIKKINTYHRYFERFSKRVMVLLEIIDVTRAGVSEKLEMKSQSRLHRETEKKSFDQAWFGAVTTIFNETAASTFSVVFLIAGGYRVIQGNMTTGDLFAFFTALSLLKKQVVIVFSVIPKVIEGVESLKSIFNFLNEKREIPYKGDQSIRFSGKLKFENVRFSYGSGKLLDGVSFTLNPGEVVLLTGPNGSGKSTIINLILGFYRPESGMIYADGESYDEIDLDDIRRSTGVVFQEPLFFPGTIRENIAYCAGEYSEEQLEEVLLLSGAGELLEEFPSGIETHVENLSDKLSGGELQKIAIARALLGDNRLIILDEPSTNLDRNSFLKIISNIKKSTAGCSVLIISHKDEPAGISDQIFELKEGKLKPLKSL